MIRSFVVLAVVVFAGVCEAANPPGVVVASSPDKENIFLASPSIAILPEGTLVASHDWSGPGMGGATRTSVYQSKNGGETWEHLADVDDIRWATLFAHRGHLYLMGVKKSFGDIVIRRSEDGGRTWTTAEDEKTGVLFQGRFHTAPVPVLVHGGRIWRAYEESENPKKRRHFSALMVSAPEDADLLDAANWTRSNALPFNPRWLNILHPEWSEGNAVAAPDGKVWNVLRMNSHPGKEDDWNLTGGAKGIPRLEVAAAVTASEDGTKVSFDPQNGFLHLPGGQAKFTIRRDPQTGLYWTIAQKITRMEKVYEFAKSPHHQRNVLVLMSSPDLRKWTERFVMLSYGTGNAMTKADRYGFQYADWQFDGEDIVAVSRTAWDALNYHDANYITFHRLKNFRALSMEDSPPDLKRGR